MFFDNFYEGRWLSFTVSLACVLCAFKKKIIDLNNEKEMKLNQKSI